MSKNIHGSVGAGGGNSHGDVRTVQYLLNCVPTKAGGPSPELAVDGIAGPLTKGAIKKFQSALGGICDGRVDPRGPTWMALAAFDPFPNMPMPQASFAKQSGGAEGATAQSIVKSVSEMVALALARSAGMEVPDIGFSAVSQVKRPGGKSSKLPPGEAKKVAEAVKKAAEAAAKAVEKVLKSGKKNPGGKKVTTGGAVLGAALEALAAAKRAAEAQAKLTGLPLPSGGLEFPPFPGSAKGGGMGGLAQKVAEVASKAAKAVEAAGGKVSKLPETASPLIPPGGGLGGLAGILKGATEAANKAVDTMTESALEAFKGAAEAAAKAVGKGSGGFKGS